MFILLLLKIIGITILMLLVLIITLLILPLIVKVSYKKEQLSLTVHILTIPFRILPRKKKKDTKEVKKKKEKTTQKDKTPFNVGLVKSMLPTIIKRIRQAARGIYIKNVKLQLVIHKDDPKDTGITSARVFTAIVAAQKLLSAFMRIKYKRVKIIPDFMYEYQDKVEFDCKIVVFPCILLVVSLGLLISFLKETRFNPELQSR